MQKTEVLIVGAGMAGASLAYFLAPHRQVIVLERESQPGYHATGRSAALYSETYGNAPVRAITTASKAFYFTPPEGFSPYPLVTPRGSLSVGGNDDRQTLQRAFDERKALVPNIEWWTQADILQRVPILKPEAAVFGVYEPDAMDMDVHGIHQGFLRGAKAAGAQVLCDAAVEQIERDGNAWRVKTTAGEFLADVVVNAAGAWCDELARMAGVTPTGLQPMRRTAFMCDVPAGCDSHAWPMVMDANEGFYLKPTPACCWCRQPTPIRLSRRTCSLKNWTWPLPWTGWRQRPRCRSAGCSANGQACARLWQTRRRLSDLRPMHQVFSGWPGRAAMASRLRPPWVNSAPRWCSISRCHRR